MYSQLKGAGPYEQPVQDNIKKALTPPPQKKGPDPEIHLHKGSFTRTSQRCMKLAREIFTALLWEESPP